MMEIRQGNILNIFEKMITIQSHAKLRSANGVLNSYVIFYDAGFAVVW